MIWLIIGFLLAIAFYFLLNWWAKTDVKSAKKGLGWAIVLVCILLTLLFLRIGKPYMAALPFLYGVWRMVGTVRFIQQWVQRIRGLAGQHGPSAGSQRGDIHLTRSEAYEVLGLEEGATKDEIHKAYRRLMAQCHPDKGGSDWMAAKLTEAKRVLTEE